ncbi:hypothetical protein SPI_05797 [Niveomyces insectorum RCEF 264]|uniref:DUF6546 domain-containing protein n=1 Tax=Niveomyces insectorum RCEF 264 TaxID=1081102 RepID=A0A167SG84_9HYPO|nr:hypothetical protein SPI_05797 [Niveomyces insectorum RCEF 264]
MKRPRIKNALCERMLRSDTQKAKAAAARAPGAWGSLPAEVRLLVLDAIVQQRHRGWSACGAVCTEWQRFVGARLFRRLTLQPSCIDAFGATVVRQRALVRSLCLTVELPRYSCRSCQRRDSLATSSRHGRPIGEALLRLLAVLHRWPAAGRLTLELDAFSPSDGEHWFKNYHPSVTDDEQQQQQQRQDQQDQPQTKDMNHWHDPRHGWVDGEQVGFPHTGAVLRLFSLLDLRLPAHLPVVPAVTELVLGRRLRRQLLPESLRLLCSRLPRLERFVYQPWHPYYVFGKVFRDTGVPSLLQSLPSHVCTLSVFEHFDERLTRMLQQDDDDLSVLDPQSLARPALVRAFVAKSRELGHLFLSHMIDAQAFFQAAGDSPSHTWPHLQTLTLTSAFLSRTTPPAQIAALLRDAGTAAARMPQLEQMVLWNSEQNGGCAVLYRRGKLRKQATLTWRGTWECEFRADVVASWQRVAANDGCDFRTAIESIPDTIHGHADALYHLRLPEGVLGSTSFRSMRQEEA